MQLQTQRHLEVIGHFTPQESRLRAGIASAPTQSPASTPPFSASQRVTIAT